MGLNRREQARLGVKQLNEAKQSWKTHDKPNLSSHLRYLQYSEIIECINLTIFGVLVPILANF